ncbi:ATP-binding cassette domain-containing protein [Gemmatimonadota bacterium]
MICGLERVSFRYRGRSANALTDVDLEVEEGTHVALVGPNGAGKSTILRLLTGVLTPDVGRATVFGRKARGWKRRDMARQVAVVSQGGGGRGADLGKGVSEHGPAPLREPLVGIGK